MSELNGESRNLIDGELGGASSGNTFDNINPATEEVIGQVADASLERGGVTVFIRMMSLLRGLSILRCWHSTTA